MTTSNATPTGMPATDMSVADMATSSTSATDASAAGSARSMRPPSPHRPGPFEREIVAKFLKDRAGAAGIGEARRSRRGGRHDAYRDDDAYPEPGEDYQDPHQDCSAEHSAPPVRRLRGIARRQGARMHATPTHATHASPLTVATALRFARALDAVPGLVDGLWIGAPRLVITIPDPMVLTILRTLWPRLVYGEDPRIERIAKSLDPVAAGEADVLTLVAEEPRKPRERDEDERVFLQALQVARPIVCLAIDAATCLSPAVLRAAEHRLVLPPLDPDLIATTIRIVSGRRCRAADMARLAGLDPTMADLAIAVRADRSPGACITQLVRLAEQLPERSGLGRDLRLDQVHGAREAVAWARSTLADLAAWRAGGPWQDVSSGALLFGPPGCGKTLMAAVMAAEGGLPMVTGSLARWQSEDAAHLGTTLRAMRRAFEEARTKAMSGPSGRRGCLLLIDEIDSFPDRSKILHSHRDYVVEVGNALLEQLDGATSREGVVVIGTTNDPSRIDPAVLRPGRLGRLIELGYPDLDERVMMLRVRLGPDLTDVDLIPVARLTERATGAAIEALVADARRIARQAGRPIRLADLIAVAGQADAEVSPALLRRTAVHESGHALLAALEFGTENLVVALQSRDGAAGWLDFGALAAEGTRAEIETRIRVMLAGRAAEEVVLGTLSAGARGDLVAATTLAAHLVATWGLGSCGPLSLGLERPAEILSDRRLRDEAADLLARLHEEACALLRVHREALDRIAERLLAERRLDGRQVAALIDPHRTGGSSS